MSRSEPRFLSGPLFGVPGTVPGNKRAYINMSGQKIVAQVNKRAHLLALAEHGEDYVETALLFITSFIIMWVWLWHYIEF